MIELCIILAEVKTFVSVATKLERFISSLRATHYTFLQEYTYL